MAASAAVAEDEHWTWNFPFSGRFHCKFIEEALLTLGRGNARFREILMTPDGKMRAYPGSGASSDYGLVQGLGDNAFVVMQKVRKEIVKRRLSPPMGSLREPDVERRFRFKRVFVSDWHNFEGEGLLRETASNGSALDTGFAISYTQERVDDVWQSGADLTRSTLEAGVFPGAFWFDRMAKSQNGCESGWAEFGLEPYRQWPTLSLYKNKAIDQETEAGRNRVALRFSALDQLLQTVSFPEREQMMRAAATLTADGSGNMRAWPIAERAVARAHGNLWMADLHMLVLLADCMEMIADDASWDGARRVMETYTGARALGRTAELAAVFDGFCAHIGAAWRAAEALNLEVPFANSEAFWCADVFDESDKVSAYLGYGTAQSSTLTRERMERALGVVGRFDVAMGHVSRLSRKNAEPSAAVSALCAASRAQIGLLVQVDWKKEDADFACVWKASPGRCLLCLGRALLNVRPLAIRRLYLFVRNMGGRAEFSLVCSLPDCEQYELSRWGGDMAWDKVPMRGVWTVPIPAAQPISETDGRVRHLGTDVAEVIVDVLSVSLASTEYWPTVKYDPQ